MEPPEKGTRILKMDLCPVKQDVDLITMTYGFKRQYLIPIFFKWF